MYSGNPVIQTKAEEEADTTSSPMMCNIPEKIRDSTSLLLGLSTSDVDQALERAGTSDCATGSCSQELKLQLLTYHNSLLPISKLPAEIFSQIFHRCVSECLRSKKETNYLWIDFFGPASPWGSFTHVCRAWRRIAVEDPSLWTRPCLDRAHLGRLMLDRAQNMPLEIIWDESTGRSKLRDVLQLALCKPENIKLLDLEMPYRPLLESLSKLPSVPATRLIDLKVGSSSHDHTLLENNLDEATTPSIIAPQLEVVCLRFCVFPLSLQEPLKHLSRLTISNGGDRRPTLQMRIRLDQLLTLLLDSPNLQSVDLEFALRVAPKTQLPCKSSSFCLKRLESLTVTDTLGNGALEFLRRLSMPNVNKLFVQLFSGRELSARECSFLFSKVQEVANCLQVPAWRNLTVRGERDMQVEIGSFEYLPIEERMNCSSWYKPEPGHLGCQFDLRFLLHSNDDPTSLITHIKDGFSLDRVDGLCSDTESGWELTKFLPNLAYVFLLKSSCLSFVYDMCADWSIDDQRLPTTPWTITCINVNMLRVLRLLVRKTAIQLGDQETQRLHLYFKTPKHKFQYEFVSSREVEKLVTILEARGILVDFHPIESYWPYSPLSRAHDQRENADDYDSEVSSNDL